MYMMKLRHLLGVELEANFREWKTRCLLLPPYYSYSVSNLDPVPSCGNFPFVQRISLLREIQVWISPFYSQKIRYFLSWVAISFFKILILLLQHFNRQCFWIDLNLDNKWLYRCRFDVQYEENWMFRRHPKRGNVMHNISCNQPPNKLK